MDTQLVENAKHINLVDLVERRLGPPVRKSGKWVQWRCPFHADSKSPSFSVNKENNSWRCFGACSTGGDAIKFIMQLDNLPFPQAVERLATPGVFPVHDVKAPAVRPPDYTAWNRQAHQLVSKARAALFSQVGEKALAYLQEERCLTVETINQASLGLIPADIYMTREDWGLPGDGSVWIPRGIIIPYIAQGRVWAVNIRRPSGLPKYYKIPGSQPAVYNYDDLRGACLATFTEGEFDAMLLYQDVPESTAATLGGAAVSRVDLSVWGGNLMTIPELYAVSDNDMAGLKLAGGLGELSKRFKRMTLPAGKDITEYRRSGGDLAAWYFEQLDQA